MTPGYRVPVHAIAWLWVFVLVAADLKISLHPGVHWAVTACALTLLLPVLVTARFPVGRPAQSCPVCFAALLVIGSLTVTLNSAGGFYGVWQAAKIVLILLAVFPFFIARSDVAYSGFRAFHCAVLANAGLLLCGMLGWPLVARVMTADGRWGTLLNYPGSLWRVGILSLVYAAYALLQHPRRLRHLGLLVASVLLVYFDGSRTGILVAMTAPSYLCLILLFERKRPAGIVLGFLLLGASVIGGGLLLTGGETVRTLPVPARIGDLSLVSTGGILERADPIRYQMVQAGIRAIRENPFWGTGFATTRVPTPVGPMVIHNAYIQVWADLGLVSFVALVGLVWCWLFWLPRFLARVREEPDSRHRGMYYSSAFLLFAFAASLAFHPLSTEWSEWITYIVPYTLFVKGLQRS